MVALEDPPRFAVGEPGSLGLIENQYGVVGLVRSELAAAQPLVDGGVDPDWALFARLALAETKIVSIPEPLASHRGNPGRVTDVPGEGLMVLDAFEEQHVVMRDLPQLAATLGAANARLASAVESSAPQPAPAFLRRLLRAAARRRRP